MGATISRIRRITSNKCPYPHRREERSFIFKMPCKQCECETTHVLGLCDIPQCSRIELDNVSTTGLCKECQTICFVMVSWQRNDEGTFVPVVEKGGNVS